ncbi:MAG TPA: chemotaxis protein CheW [Vicinamibacterales bacterium]|nr:chemotaxis protein CheW [Vicinamibacterales bacterium]
MSQDNAIASLAGKYLTFALADEEYGVPVLKVREIIKVMDITAVPKMPPHVRGVINLRGKVIPVVDLRTKFDLPSVEFTDQTCIIVVEVEMQGRKVMLGAIVDCVLEVLNITAEEIDPRPDFGERLDTGYMLGVAKVRGRVEILLDLDRVLADGSLITKAA